MAVSLFPSVEDKSRFVSVLKDHGVRYIEVSFAGSGDSGSIEDVAFFKGTQSETAELTRTLKKLPFKGWGEKSKWDEANGKWVRSFAYEDMTLGQLVEALAYDALERTGLDWYNNDGGQGTFRIDLDAGNEPVVSLDVGINYTETNDYSFAFDGGEEQ
jgi:hypothetical protein